MKPVSETVNPHRYSSGYLNAHVLDAGALSALLGLVSRVASADADGERGPGLPPLRFVMSPERSHAHVQLGHQLYPILEQCRKPEALWAKLATGNYDWLGVRRNGKYVLGRPRLSTVMPEEPAVSPDDTKGSHRVEFLSPLQRIPRWEACQSPEEAREAFQRMVDGDPVTPLRSSGVWRVRLVLDGRSVEERLVVRPLPRFV